MIIVGISGKAQSGKNLATDTICSVCDSKHIDFLEMAFADKLKEIVRDCFGVSEKLLWGSGKDKESLTHIEWDNVLVNPAYKLEYLKSKIIKNYKYLTARELLQYIGTDIFRKIDSLAWVRPVESYIQTIKEDEEKYSSRSSFVEQTVIVITDVRFISECDMIKKFGGEIWRVCRGKLEKDSHASETELDKYDGFNTIIDNNGSKKQYVEKIKQLFGELLESRKNIG